MYKVLNSRQAKKDAVNIERNGLRPQVEKIFTTVKRDPFEKSQSFEELKGRLKGKYSRRINIAHRFVYEILPNENNEVDENGAIYEGIVWVLSMWTHYDRV
ncbi:MAG: Txe/YoeB family addiction module toxin [Oscillospiraceae bacterium]|nr:Txe/YoeB family addiction module toxin [Oscillospiraceae bacterium]